MLVPAMLKHEPSGTLGLDRTREGAGRSMGSLPISRYGAVRL